MENNSHTRVVYEIPVLKETYDEPRRSSYGWQQQPPQQTARTYAQQPESASSTFREIPVMRQNATPQPPGRGWSELQQGFETGPPTLRSTANVAPTFGRGPYVTRVPVHAEAPDNGPEVLVSRLEFTPHQVGESFPDQNLPAGGNEAQRFSEPEQVPIEITGVGVREVPAGKESLTGDRGGSVGAREIPVVFEPPSEKAEETTEKQEQAGNKSVSGESVRPSRGSPDSGLKVDPPKRGRSPSPAPPNTTPLEQIELIMAEARKQKAEVDRFVGSKQDKVFLIIEEMLTRLLIKLDRIDSEGKEEIRNARRDAVKQVQASLDLLESKAKSKGSEEKQLKGNENSSTDSTSVCNEREDSALETAAAVKEMTLGSEVPC